MNDDQNTEASKQNLELELQERWCQQLRAERLFHGDLADLDEAHRDDEP